MNNLGIAYNNYGFSLMKKGDWRGAIEKYEDALFYDPDNAFTLYNLGQAYYSVQDMTKAKERLEKAKKLGATFPGLDGLLHVSELSNEYVRNVGDVVKEGDVIDVKLIFIDDQGRIKLSRKAVLMEAKGLEYKMEPQAPRRDRGPRR